MGVRFGINPIGWSNDDLRSLGGDIPLETCLREARQAGFEGVELGHKFPRQPAALSAALAPHDLALVSGWYSARLLERSVEEEIEALQDHLALLKALGCTVMVFAETTGCVHGDVDVPLSRRPQIGDAEWDRLCQGMTAIGEYLHGQGVRLAYHHHMGTVVQTEVDIDRLMSSTGAAVGLLLDTGHLTYAGGDPLRIARSHAGRVVHVHLKDIRGDILERVRAADAPFLAAVPEGVFTVPGDGIVDYLPIFELLKKRDYSGWLVVEAEQDPEKANPSTYAQLGYNNITSWAHQVGLHNA